MLDIFIPQWKKIWDRWTLTLMGGMEIINSPDTHQLYSEKDIIWWNVCLLTENVICRRLRIDDWNRKWHTRTDDNRIRSDVIGEVLLSTAWLNEENECFQTQINIQVRHLLQLPLSITPKIDPIMLATLQLLSLSPSVSMPCINGSIWSN